MREFARRGFWAAVPVLLAAGCSMPGTGPNVSTVAFPVLVGPVDRLGGGRGDLGKRIQRVEAEATFSVVSSSSTQQYSGYQVTTTRTETFQGDAVASTIHGSAAGVPGALVKLNDLKAVQHYHVSLFGVMSRYVWVEADIFGADGRGTGGAGPATRESRP